MRGILKGIRKKLTFFIPIKEPPEWVRKAYERWEQSLSAHPYDKAKRFVGKHYVYRVTHGTGAQGQAPITGWYKKKRIYS